MGERFWGLVVEHWRGDYSLARDQFDNAKRVKALGVGARLDVMRLTAPRLAKPVETLLKTSELRAHCHRASVALQNGESFADVCARLVGFARSSR
jgi:rhamnosyltransferase subunit B